jgi:hypothetical protein
MPVRYEVSADGKFVRATATGELKVEEIHGFIKAVAEDDRIKPGFLELFDVRRISASQVKPESFARIRQLVMDNPKRLPGSQLAIVVATGSSYDKARQYEAAASPDVENVIVFNDMATAEVWLGIPDMKTEPSGSPNPE